MLPHGPDTVIEDEAGRRRRALVFVPPTSPFLSAAAIAQRERHCVVAAGDAGLAVVADEGTSSRTRTLEQVCQVLTRTGTSLLITWSGHGLVSKPAELDLLCRAMAGGLTVLTVRSGVLEPLTEPVLRAIAAAGQTQAATERREHSVRTREGRRAVARSGQWLGGRHPLGWVVAADGSAMLDERAAGHIRAATERIAAGASVGQLVAQWNHAGFRTATGRLWTFSSLRRVVVRARNAGLVEYRGEIVGRSVWPAIVTVAQWRQACRMLDRTRRDRATA